MQDYTTQLSAIMPRQKRQNGTQAGKNAIVIALGRSAAVAMQSLFDNPYEAGSEYAELWFGGFLGKDPNLIAERIALNPPKVRKEWTHVLSADGKSFTSPAIARNYMNIHNIKGTIKFIR